MIHSIIPNEVIFPENDVPEISYIRKNGVVLEVTDGAVRRIISTNPTDYLASDSPENITFS